MIGYIVEKLAQPSKKGGRLEPQTVNKHLKLLGRTLRIAQKWKLVGAIPEISMLEEREPKFDFLDFEEADAFMAAAAELEHVNLDDPNLMAMQLTSNLIHQCLGIHAIAARIERLVRRLVTGLRGLGLEFVTPLDPRLRHGVVVFAYERNESLYRHLDRHPELRLCPHFYNTNEDIDGVVKAIAGHMTHASMMKSTKASEMH